jgi:hypothetical protein
MPRRQGRSRPYSKEGRTKLCRDGQDNGCTPLHDWKVVRQRYHHYRMLIETRSSRPRSHPRTLDSIVKRIIELRIELGRSAPVIQKELALEGITISSSVIGKKLKHLKLTRRNRHHTTNRSRDLGQRRQAS